MSRVIAPIARRGRALAPLALPALALLVAALALWLWGAGGAEAVARRAAEGQRAVQNALAGALRSLRAGEAGALWGLWGLCFGYGVLHAAGPGHGKLVVGAYGVGRRVAAARLAALAVAASLAQAGTAVALVGAGVLVLGLGREEMQDLADGALARLSAVLVAGVGAWLLWRGGRTLLRARRAGRPAHHHDHGPSCASCGHAHGVAPEAAARVGSLGEAAALVVAVAARPCSGAILLLVLTWRMGLFPAGVAGAVAMALGTATVTVAVAIGAVALREGALGRTLGAGAPGRGAARALAAAEAAGGLLVLLLAWELLRQGG